MKKSLFFLASAVLFCHQVWAQEGIDGAENEGNTPSTQVDSKTEKKPLAWKDSIRPPEISSSSYGVFRLGYSYQYQNGGNITKTGEKPFAYSGHFNGMYFGIERGWIGGKDNMFMVGGYLDGVAGQTYALSVGVKGSLFLLNGWVLPYVGIGYQLEHLEFANDTKQYNMHTGVVSVGAHVNVAKGFGVDFQLRSGLPFNILKANDAQTYGNPSINHVGFMVSLSFYDFSI